MPRAGHLDREDEDGGDGGEKLDCGELGGGAQACEEVAVKDVVNQLEEESIYEKQSTTSYFGSKDEEW